MNPAKAFHQTAMEYHVFADVPVVASVKSNFSETSLASPTSSFELSPKPISFVTIMPAKTKNIIFDLSKGKLIYLEPYLPNLLELCEKYSVEKLYAFGSLVYGDFDEEKSDLDFLVRFKENDKVGMELIDMLIDLEKLFNKKVDLLRDRPFKNEYFARSVENSKTLLYAA